MCLELVFKVACLYPLQATIADEFACDTACMKPNLHRAHLNSKNPLCMLILFIKHRIGLKTAVKTKSQSSNSINVSILACFQCHGEMSDNPLGTGIKHWI